MITSLNKFIQHKESLGYLYCGTTKKGDYKFMSHKDNYLNNYYYNEISCKYCGKPHFKCKYRPIDAHKYCASKEAIKFAHKFSNQNLKLDYDKSRIDNLKDLIHYKQEILGHYYIGKMENGDIKFKSVKNNKYFSLYYQEIICNICNKPFFRNKYRKSRSHHGCANAKTSYLKKAKNEKLS